MEEESDYEDTSEENLKSLSTENAILYRFVDWLPGVDGEFKPLWAALQHKSVLMSAGRTSLKHI